MTGASSTYCCRHWAIRAASCWRLCSSVRSYSRRFVFLLERQFHELLLRLDDLQLGRGERGVEPRLGVLLREVVLGRGFVVGGGDHGFGQKQRIPLQRAAAVVEILQQQRTLPFEFGVILAVLGDLFAQKLFLRAILSVAR